MVMEEVVLAFTLREISLGTCCAVLAFCFAVITPFFYPRTESFS
jgi:hypothetical protein